MTLIFERDLDNDKTNQRARYLDRKVITGPSTQRPD